MCPGCQLIWGTLPKSVKCSPHLEVAIRGLVKQSLINQKKKIKIRDEEYCLGITPTLMFVKHCKLSGARSPVENYPQA